MKGLSMRPGRAQLGCCQWQETWPVKEGEDGAVVSDSYTTPIPLVLKEHPGWVAGQAGASFSAPDRYWATERGGSRVQCRCCPGVAPSPMRVTKSEPTSPQECSE